MKLYHYSSLKNLESILENGICPREVTKKLGNWKIGKDGKNANGYPQSVYSNKHLVYLITIQNWDAFWIRRKKETVVKFTIDINDIDVNNLRADDNYHFAMNGRSSLDLLKTTHLNKDWKKSLEYNDTCSHFGIIKNFKYNILKN